MSDSRRQKGQASYRDYFQRARCKLSNYHYRSYSILLKSLLYNNVSRGHREFRVRILIQAAYFILLSRFYCETVIGYDNIRTYVSWIFMSLLIMMKNSLPTNTEDRTNGLINDTYSIN